MTRSERGEPRCDVAVFALKLLLFESVDEFSAKNPCRPGQLSVEINTPLFQDPD